VFPMKYELGLHIPEDGILLIHHREDLKSYKIAFFLVTCHRIWPLRDRDASMLSVCLSVCLSVRDLIAHVSFDTCTFKMSVCDPPVFCVLRLMICQPFEMN
jgi:hypothetical protein